MEYDKETYNIALLEVGNWTLLIYSFLRKDNEAVTDSCPQGGLAQMVRALGRGILFGVPDARGRGVENLILHKIDLWNNRIDGKLTIK